MKPDVEGSRGQPTRNLTLSRDYPYPSLQNAADQLKVGTLFAGVECNVVSDTVQQIAYAAEDGLGIVPAIPVLTRKGNFG